jgi:hypothetical protein
MHAAFLAIIPGAERLAEYVVKGLAVGGGFLVGYLVGGLVVYALDRWVMSQKTPDGVKRAIRIVAGVGVAILVALIVFGDSGRGPGPGGTEGAGSGKAETAGPQPKGEPPPLQPAPKPPEPSKEPTQGFKELPVRVVLLGGAAVEGNRAYQLGDDPKKLTLEELESALVQKRKEAGDRGIRVVLERPGPDPISQESPNWTLLVRWLTKERIPPYDR